jgi:wyosine [tRNA(Phe)-imidazoG37] synthetase (radical SAM superfamily)
MLLELKPGIIYGPVNSRRLGASLGINLFPGPAKICTFDCVYCQYGWTKVKEIGAGRRGSLPDAAAVARALEDALPSLGSSPAYLTFSGNGEPTLHPDFPEMVEAVISVRDRRAPAARTAILSNSSRVMKDGLRPALTRLDARIMKLDCGTEDTFRRYSGPAAGLTLEAVTRGLADLAGLVPVTIQSLWTGGAGGNLPDPSEGAAARSEELRAWVERLVRIKPAFVQVYSLDRDTPARDLKQLGRAELSCIVDLAKSAGINASVFVR